MTLTIYLKSTKQYDGPLNQCYVPVWPVDEGSNIVEIKLGIKEAKGNSSK